MSVNTTPWPRPSTWPAAAAAETTLATTYAAASKLLPDSADWCVAASTLHAAHAVVLTQTDPWGGYTVGATPAPPLASPPKDKKGALSSLKKAIAGAGDAAKAGLAKAPAGVEALLWASLQVCCDVDAAWCDDPAVKRPAPIVGSVVPSQITLESSADAAAAALETLNALVYTLSTALGRVAGSDPLHAEMSARLAQTGALRDGLQLIIRTGGQAPAPPSLSYPLPDKIGQPDAVRPAWGQLEANLGQAYTRLAGTLGAGDGPMPASSAAAQAGDQLARATAMGQTITWWPGWV